MLITVAGTAAQISPHELTTGSLAGPGVSFKPVGSDPKPFMMYCIVLHCIVLQAYKGSPHLAAASTNPVH
jgi:hypothetical protein